MKDSQAFNLLNQFLAINTYDEKKKYDLILVLGVTEPALFGVNLKYMFPFVCGMIGSAIAATFSVATGTMATSVGVGGIPGI